MLKNIAHVGYHKTATTWFQQEFYPRVENYTYVRRKVTRDCFLYKHVFRFDETLAAEGLPCPKDLPLVICDEDISGNFHTAGLCGGWTKEVAWRIKRTVPNTQIVLFIRNQVAMLASIYQQYVREGGTHSPRRYFRPYESLDWNGFQPPKAALFQFEHFDYQGMINLYREIFGPKDVHVFLYEQFSESPDQFLEKFCTTLGLDVDVKGLSFASRNTSYSRPTMIFARLMNLFTYQNVVDKRHLVHIPGAFGVSRRLLSKINSLPFFSHRATPQEILGSAEVDYIRSTYMLSNHWLKSELGLPVESYGYL